jgi:hypothetical protein
MKKSDVCPLTWRNILEDLNVQISQKFFWKCKSGSYFGKPQYKVAFAVLATSYACQI